MDAQEFITYLWGFFFNSKAGVNVGLCDSSYDFEVFSAADSCSLVYFSALPLCMRSQIIQLGTILNFSDRGGPMINWCWVTLVHFID